MRLQPTFAALAVLLVAFQAGADEAASPDPAPAPASDASRTDAPADGRAKADDNGRASAPAAPAPATPSEVPSAIAPPAAPAAAAPDAAGSTTTPAPAPAEPPPSPSAEGNAAPKAEPAAPPVEAAPAAAAASPVTPAPPPSEPTSAPPAAAPEHKAAPAEAAVEAVPVAPAPAATPAPAPAPARAPAPPQPVATEPPVPTTPAVETPVPAPEPRLNEVALELGWNSPNNLGAHYLRHFGDSGFAAGAGIGLVTFWGPKLSILVRHVASPQSGLFEQVSLGLTMSTDNVEVPLTDGSVATFKHTAGRTIDALVGYRWAIGTSMFFDGFLGWSVNLQGTDLQTSTPPVPVDDATRTGLGLMEPGGLIWGATFGWML